jgi:hypothetical protein
MSGHGDNADPQPDHLWRRVVSVALLISYLLLAGNTIRCHYAAAGHDHHGTPQSQASDDTTACLAASHDPVTMPVIGPIGHPIVHLVGQLLADPRLTPDSTRVASASSRAPPFA